MNRQNKTIRARNDNTTRYLQEYDDMAQKYIKQMAEQHAQEMADFQKKTVRVSIEILVRICYYLSQRDNLLPFSAADLS